MHRTLISSPPSAHQSSTAWLSASLTDLLQRIVDICAALVGLILLFPVFLAIAIMIKRSSDGPVFYRALRVGRYGRPFHMLKFRTMNETQGNCQAKVTARDDPRITPLGRWLRETKINELPQLWNVLKGEMSLVGPRPEDPDLVATWPEDARREILSVRPGITSPAAVLYRNEENLLNHDQVMETYVKSILPTKLRLDQLYVRHHSLLLDLDVLLWTLLILLPTLKPFPPPEESLFLGPITRFAKRYLNWFIVDTIITLTAIGVTGVAFRLSSPLDIGLANAIVVAFGFALLFSITSALLGMYRVWWSRAYASDALGLVVSASIATLLALLVNGYLTNFPSIPPAMILAASALALVGFVTARYRTRLITGLASRWLERSRATATQERVLIVGAGYTGQFMAWLLSNGFHASAFHVVGFVDDDLSKLGMRYQRVNVLGRREDIPQLVEKCDVGLIIFAIHNIEMEERRHLVDICASTSARVAIVPDILAILKSVVAEKKKVGNKIFVGNHSPEFVSPSGDGIPAAQVRLWLDNLERTARTGDVATVYAQICSLRSQIHNIGVGK